jgi:NAD(P)-dependent dehydrogenase (short-subunit alcohol dehydrogenase family)
MVSIFSAVFPPSPTFTDKNLQDLTSKVFIITGAASGVGYELAKMLFIAGGTVYIAARSLARCQSAIDAMQEQAAGKVARGKLKYMVIDLSDLSTVKSAVDDFLKNETRLDVLVNNAGVMNTPLGSKGKQVYQYASNLYRQAKVDES